MNPVSDCISVTISGWLTPWKNCAIWEIPLSWSGTWQGHDAGCGLRGGYGTESRSFGWWSRFLRYTGRNDEDQHRHRSTWMENEYRGSGRTKKRQRHSLVLKGAWKQPERRWCGFPLGKLVCVTGVSGSGKSTLINDTLQTDSFPALLSFTARSFAVWQHWRAGIHWQGGERRPVAVRKNPNVRIRLPIPESFPTYVTCLSVFRKPRFAAIRQVVSLSTCRRWTLQRSMWKRLQDHWNELPSRCWCRVVCHGKRYNRETLEVRYKGKSIADVLDMTINRAVEFFENVPQILEQNQSAAGGGIRYIKLGAALYYFVGGESQRVKLATELAKGIPERRFIFLDEPTTGLHFEDIGTDERVEPSGGKAPYRHCHRAQTWMSLRWQTIWLSIWDRRRKGRRTVAGVRYTGSHYCRERIYIRIFKRTERSNKIMAKTRL